MIRHNHGIIQQFILHTHANLLQRKVILLLPIWRKNSDIFCVLFSFIVCRTYTMFVCYEHVPVPLLRSVAFTHFYGSWQLYKIRSSETNKSLKIHIVLCVCVCALILFSIWLILTASTAIYPFEALLFLPPLQTLQYVRCVECSAVHMSHSE